MADSKFQIVGSDTYALVQRLSLKADSTTAIAISAASVDAAGTPVIFPLGVGQALRIVNLTAFFLEPDGNARITINSMGIRLDPNGSGGFVRAWASQQSPMIASPFGPQLVTVESEELFVWTDYIGLGAVSQAGFSAFANVSNSDGAATHTFRMLMFCLVELYQKQLPVAGHVGY